MTDKNLTRRNAVAAITAMGGLAAASSFKTAKAQDEVVSQQAFKLTDLAQQNMETDGPYLRFFDNQTMSTGVYALKTGAVDQQQPHRYDELYIVTEGRAKLRAGNEIFDATTGSIFFVKAEIEHRFEDITEDLNVIVFFSKATPE
ncbi:cupin domain-containing protein [Kordiimonas aquimaris]|uniref:cupin domain-containing protein n=1 Tax=Kordiimonas aquimaris TaxID=707591 RepID=UPI0021D2BACB|nr:cupin domain-containing protein [Kordiimonas aquimaris]